MALLICATILILFAYSMRSPVAHTADPVPVTAELIELPTPVELHPHPQLHHETVTPPDKPAEFPIPTLPVQHDQPSEKPQLVAPIDVPPVTHNNPALTESHGAQTMLRPLPVIPDELREEAMNEAATARFHIAVDGSITVELIKPTQNLRLNRLLLESLENWKFFPAMKGGKPVASVEEIIIHVNVK